MEIKDLLNLIENGYKEESIILPFFVFYGTNVHNTTFVKMGYTYDGKTIYQSKNCLDNIRISINDLLKIKDKIKDNKGIGECDVCKKAEDSLDKAVFQVLGKHIQPYTRTYDGHTSSEKIFLPLECEISGEIKYSEDSSIINKYPQWDGFKTNDKLKIKSINDRDIWYWWSANKSKVDTLWCNNNNLGIISHNLSYFNESGVSIAFCV